MDGLLDSLPILTVRDCLYDLLVRFPKIFKFLIVQLRQAVKTESAFILPVGFLFIPGLFQLLRDGLFQLVPIQDAALLSGQHFLPGHGQHPLNTDDFQLIAEHCHEQINRRQFDHEAVRADNFAIARDHMVRRFYRILRLVLGEKRHHGHIVVRIIADTLNSAFNRGNVCKDPTVPVWPVWLESFGVDFIEIGEGIREIVKDPPLVICHVFHVPGDFFKTPFSPQESGSIIDLHVLVCAHLVRVHADGIEAHTIFHYFVLTVRIGSAVATLKGVYFIQDVWTGPFPSEICYSHRIINLLSFNHDYLGFMLLSVTRETCERHRKRAQSLNDQIGFLIHENIKAFIHDSNIIFNVCLDILRIIFEPFRNVLIRHVIGLGSIQLVRLFADHSRHPDAPESRHLQEIPEKDMTKLQLNQIGICSGGDYFKVTVTRKDDPPQNV